MHLNRDNETFIINIANYGIPYPGTKECHFFVPVETLKRSLFLVPCERMFLFLEKNWWINFGTSS